MTEKPKYVINKETNIVYAYNKRLLEREGFEVYEGELPPIDRTTGHRVVRDVPDPLGGIAAVKKPIDERTEGEKRIAAIVEALATFKKIDFATGSGKPNLSRVERAVGFKPTKEERDEAFEAWEKIQETD